MLIALRDGHPKSKEPQMDVMMTARNIGLIGSDGANVFGTIERHVVLSTLDELALTAVDDADLFATAVSRVNAARSAGVEKLGAMSFLGRQDETGEIQLSYRAEMADIFMDLAIDLGIRHTKPRAITPVL